MTASSYPDDGVGEVFLKLGKQGSTLAGVMDAFSMAISVGLQYGIPLESYVAKFTNMRFEPAGLTDDPDIRIASSVMDYIFRRLALDHLPYEDRAELGILSAAERDGRGGRPTTRRAGRGGGPRRAGPVGRRRTTSYRTDLGSRPSQPAMPSRSAAARPSGRPAQHGRTDRVPAGPHRGRSALPHLRHQDAPGGQLLRLRRLRLHQRLQLKPYRPREELAWSGGVQTNSCTPPDAHHRQLMLHLMQRLAGTHPPLTAGPARDTNRVHSRAGRRGGRRPCPPRDPARPGTQPRGRRARSRPCG